MDNQFEALQAKLVPLWTSIRSLNQDAQTIVIVPSMNVDAAISGVRQQALEERFLFLLLLLRQPRARVIYVTSQAIHPEVIGSGQGILSPDLIGPLRERLQEKGGGAGIFMNSAQGGMVTADNRAPEGKERRTWAECGRIGSLLADEALRIIEKAPVQKSPKLFCAARSISFPVESPLLQAVMKSSPLGYPTNDLRRVSTQLNVLNIGDAQILTIPGEALPNIGYISSARCTGRTTFCSG